MIRRISLLMGASALVLLASGCASSSRLDTRIRGACEGRDCRPAGEIIAESFLRRAADGGCVVFIRTGTDQAPARETKAIAKGLSGRKGFLLGSREIVESAAARRLERLFSEGGVRVQRAVLDDSRSPLPIAPYSSYCGATPVVDVSAPEVSFAEVYAPLLSEADSRALAKRTLLLVVRND